ncbi:transposase [Xanthomonas populi]
MSEAKRAQKDVDARWTSKHGTAYYGYKLHANVDRRWGLIRVHEVSSANVHDSRHFECAGCGQYLAHASRRQRLCRPRP